MKHEPTVGDLGRVGTIVYLIVMVIGTALILWFLSSKLSCERSAPRDPIPHIGDVVTIRAAEGDFAVAGKTIDILERVAQLERANDAVGLDTLRKSPLTFLLARGQKVRVLDRVSRSFEIRVESGMYAGWSGWVDLGSIGYDSP